ALPISGLGLGLPLARKVVELHGGRLVLEQELDGFVTCIIELPAGTSPLPSQDMNVAQAQRYANDLVRLLSDRNTAAAERASS
ncbi:ATP-binding protein, partial [Arthrospira platensis SPKY1]|nr:ATP-binding protein [Arthrospira platensis SPKY1]